MTSERVGRLAVDFGARIREARLTRRLTLANVASAIGMEKTGLSRLEAGQRASIKFDVLTRLSGVLQSPLEVLLRERPRKREARR